MDKDRIKRFVIIVIMIVVIVLFISLITKKYVIDNDDKNNFNSIIDNTQTIYKFGDKVTLKDNSTWYVLYDSKNTETDVTLLSFNNYNNSNLKNTEINNYLRHEFTDNLMYSISSSRSDISEVRMLMIEDLEKTLGTDKDTLLKKYNIKEKEIFKNNTLIDYYNNDNYYSICDNNICNSDNRELRVVIKINKYYVKKLV